MSAPLGIIELLRRIGEDRIGVQFLDGAATNYTARRDGVTLLTFGTQAVTPSQVVNDSGPMGIVVWLPRDLVEKVRAEHAESQPDRPCCLAHASGQSRSIDCSLHRARVAIDAARERVRPLIEREERGERGDA